MIFWSRRALAAAALSLAMAVLYPASAGARDEIPDQEDLPVDEAPAEDAPVEETPPAPLPPEDAKPATPQNSSDREDLEDLLFGGPDDGPETTPGTPGDEPPPPGINKDLLDFEPLSIGGQAYLRSSLSFVDRGKLGAQQLSLPNLLDLYIDARPEDRVRAYIQGRLSYDPTVGASSVDAIGNPRQSTSVALDQLWLKTDIARTVFLTVGKERVKWGSSRIWNPTDVVNGQRRDPVAFLDVRLGVPLVKVHVPWESSNFYGILLADGAGRLDRLAAAFRAEFAFPSLEISASALAGSGRKTTFGLDVSAALGPLDVTIEAALVDQRDTLRYSGNFDLNTFELPVGTPDGKWRPSVTFGMSHTFNVFDDDVFVLGAEYFWNPGGSDEVQLYPFQILTGSLQPFYLGKHYAALFMLLPSPGSWDRMTFNLSALGNLSDQSFILRFDTMATIHTRLRLEAFIQGSMGQRGGEFRFAMEVPDIPPIPDVLPDGLEAFSIAAPVLSLGLNLRLTL